MPFFSISDRDLAQDPFRGASHFTVLFKCRDDAAFFFLSCIVTQYNVSVIKLDLPVLNIDNGKNRIF